MRPNDICAADKLMLECLQAWPRVAIPPHSRTTREALNLHTPIEPAIPDGLLFGPPAPLHPSTVDHRERRTTWRRSLGIGRRLDKLANRPDMIGIAQRHRWRHADCLMNPAEIVVRDKQRNRRFVVGDQRP